MRTATMTTTTELDDFEGLTHRYERELLAHCYRMSGSFHEAEDLVQETFLRAWKASAQFQGRSSVRTWLYRIATNVCLTNLEGRPRRPLPAGLGTPDQLAGDALEADPEIPWLEPVPDAAVVVAERDSIRLAFVAALQHLPARQRATLIMCEVLKMPAAEAADTLGTSVAAVNSALQRARATLAALPEEQRPASVDADQSELLAKYVDAFQRYDMEQLVTLLHDDALMTMPPYSFWVRGAGDIIRWMQEPSPSLCRDSIMVPAGQVNGSPAWAQYKPDPAGGHQPWALQVNEVSGGRISRMTFFLETERIFPAFGLPPHLG